LNTGTRSCFKNSGKYYNNNRTNNKYRFNQDVVEISLFKQLPQAEQYVGTILPQEEHS
jgi:hypothetical protein